MSTTQFRYILIAYFVLAMIGGEFDFIFPSALPEVLANTQLTNFANLSPLSHRLLAILGRIALVGGIASTLGLYLFRPWAPRLAVVITILALFIWPLLGFSIASGWKEFISSIATMLWGAILALIYISPLKERFVVSR